MPQGSFFHCRGLVATALPPWAEGLSCYYPLLLRQANYDIITSELSAVGGSYKTSLEHEGNKVISQKMKHSFFWATIF